MILYTLDAQNKLMRDFLDNKREVLDFRSEGKVISGGQDKKLKLGDIEKGNCLKTLVSLQKIKKWPS